jgi:hypothetical protein
LLWLLLIEHARSAEYVVDGWKLGANVTSGSLQSYSRTPDPAFAQLTSCTRNRGNLVGVLMRNEDGAIVFLKVKVAPTNISEDQIKKEIVDLSGEFGGEPSSVNWVDRYPGGGRSTDHYHLPTIRHSHSTPRRRPSKQSKLTILARRSPIHKPPSHHVNLRRPTYSGFRQQTL